ncbi:phosphopantothenoylcysteine decarboxylase [Nannochloropsis oceanica]
MTGSMESIAPQSPGQRRRPRNFFPPDIPGQRRPHVLLAATGSVATIKVPEIAVRLTKDISAKVKVVLTTSAQHFWDRAKKYNPAAWTEFEALQDEIMVLEDKDEWEEWDAMGDGVLHIQVRDWADLMLIAPLSANTLGKLANGLCDNLLTSVVRAWDVRRPVVVAPAMNTHMWTHPFTARQLGMLQADLGYHVVPPVSKLLACGDAGQGGLATVEDLVAAVKKYLGRY